MSLAPPNPRIGRGFVTMFLAFAFSAACSPQRGAATGAAAQAAPGTSTGAARNGVLVELFTSQGCSSCPPADELFGRIDKVAPGAVAVAWHVDYWNRLGWTDPFSDAEWTARQNEYARVWKRERVYTPQAVIAGEKHMVGSDERGLGREVAQPRSASARIDIEPLPGAEGDRVTVRIRVRPETGAAGDRVPVAVLVENNLVTRVPRGENAGRTLREDHVARLRNTLPAIRLAACAGTPDEGAACEIETVFRLDPAWKTGELAVVVFLQDPETLRVDAAAVAPLPRK